MKHYNHFIPHIAYPQMHNSVRIGGTREEIAEFIGLMAQKQTAFGNEESHIHKVNNALNGKKLPRHPVIPTHPKSLHICLRLEQKGNVYVSRNYMWGYNYKTERRVTTFERNNRRTKSENNVFILSLVLKRWPNGEGQHTPSDYLERIERELETGESHINRTFEPINSTLVEPSPIEEDDMPVLDESNNKHGYKYGYNFLSKSDLADEEVFEDENETIDGGGND
jgi:hypothetical protein